MIINHPKEVALYIKEYYSSNKLYLTSGGFDPMHVGHLRCIKKTAELAQTNNGIVIIVVNGDGFLQRKKGYSFMPEPERMEIIDGIGGVDIVTAWDDGSQFVTGAIDIIRPNYFTKGGDRTSAANVPEFKLCQEIGCEVIFNVGGGKIQSSSTLVSNMKKYRISNS